MGGVGDRKKGEEEVWRRPNPNCCPCLAPDDDAGIAVLEEEEEECDDDKDDFEEARIVRRWSAAAKEGCDRWICSCCGCCGAAVATDRGE